MTKTNLQQILLARHYLLECPQNEDATKVAYLNAYLLANFGIIVDKPHLLTPEHVNQISELYRLNVPRSFYANPQDMKYFSCGELLVEQLVSYFLVETGTGIYDRVEIFDKDLPQYKQGDEIKLREVKILTAAEADAVLADIAKAYCAYRRPWSLEEEVEFLYLYTKGYYRDYEMLCGDNAITMLKSDPSFARFLYKKDLVKMSIAACGEKSKLSLDKNTAYIIRQALPLVKDCPMSKKQAKYFNTLVNKVGARGKIKEATNAQSPHKAANAALANGNVLEAARIYANNGSLLTRNIKFLLSRANPKEAVEILDMLPNQNPVALYQLVSTLSEDDGNNRTFTFTKNRLVKKHVETDYERTWRKSKLNDSTKKLLHDTVFDNIKNYYRALDTLGKVYISPAFYKIGVPTNTSAGGKGIDVIPTGSRLAIPYNNIRTFVYWKNAFDIDASLSLVKEDGKQDVIYFGNYAAKPFGTSILFSGDCRDRDGAEYYDIKLDELAEKGYKYVLYHINGYCSNLNSGDIFCGYQNKENLNTKAWDAKNIAMQFRVKGDSRSALSFAIDLTTKEIIVLNLVTDSESRIMSVKSLDVIKKYLSDNYLELNMGLVADCRGQVVDTPEEADVVFDDNYTPVEGQKVIRTYELEKLVALANGIELN